MFLMNKSKDITHKRIFHSKFVDIFETNNFTP